MRKRSLSEQRAKSREKRYVVSSFGRTVVTGAIAVLALAGSALAQATPPMEVVTIDEAVQRALKNNPTIAQASQGILRAESLLQQAKAVNRPNVSAAFSNVIVDQSRRFNDTVIQPRSQSTLGARVAMPVLAASQWAAATQAGDQVEIANLSTADVRRTIAVATAQTYLEIIAQKRQVEVGIRARETSLAHLDYARRRLEAGAGTRLNELRAGQEVATNEARVETAQLAVRRAQEALGVLIAANGPADAAAEPTFELPPTPDEPTWMASRPDIQLFTANERAAERVWHDSTKDLFPTGTVSFDPQALVPSSICSTSWRLTLMFTLPVFDGGQRRGLRSFRESAFNTSRLALTELQIQARSEVRLAQETVQSSERALASLRSAAEQADEVLKITNFAFEAGATTNLEVIDAQRQARDADSAAAVAEDTVRRARLDLLTALGRFP
jgi:outer membrane protein